MAKKATEFSVEELKKLEPMANFHVFNTHCKYLIFLPKRRLITLDEAGENDARQKQIKSAQNMLLILQNMGVEAAIFSIDDENMPMFYKFETGRG